MTLTEKAAGSAVFAFALCGVLLSVHGDTPLAQAGLSQSAEAPRHCLDMNGKPFEWRSVNVPFAASCDAMPDAAK
jgi:hypothetical protein